LFHSSQTVSHLVGTHSYRQSAIFRQRKTSPPKFHSTWAPDAPTSIRHSLRRTCQSNVLSFFSLDRENFHIFNVHFFRCRRLRAMSATVDDCIARDHFMLAAKPLSEIANGSF
jgi:hypothetical protein